MKIVICDNEQVFVDMLSRQVEPLFLKYDENVNISTFTNGHMAIEYIRENDVDVIFLDIDMPDIHGFNVAGKIQREKPNTNIIFVTSYQHLVYDSYIYQPFWFVRKAHLEDLALVIETLMKKLTREKMMYEFNKGNEIIQIMTNDILYFESSRHYVILHTKNLTHKYKAKIGELEERFAPFDFVRTHVGYLVNCQHIRNINSDAVVLNTGANIPVSRSNLKQTKEKFLQYNRKIRRAP